MILVVSELLSQEQDFRRHGCPGATRQTFMNCNPSRSSLPDDNNKDGAEVTPPDNLETETWELSFAQSRVTDQIFFDERLKIP